MIVKAGVVPKHNVRLIWDLILPGLEIYRQKTPHRLAPKEEILENLESDYGDELFFICADGRYAGFMTFKVQPLEDELWGTISIIYILPEFQNGSVLEEAANQLAELLRSRGCHRMNYFTAREGFKRLAPRLGFKPRIIEWSKELR